MRHLKSKDSREEERKGLTLQLVVNCKDLRKMATASIPPVLALSIFTAILGMFQFGFNTGVVNAPQVSYPSFQSNLEILDLNLFSNVLILG